MKKRFGLPLLCFVLMGLMACNKEAVKEEDIQEFVMNYSAARYNVKHPSQPPTSDEIADKVKEYLSKEEYDKQLAISLLCPSIHVGEGIT